MNSNSEVRPLVVISKCIEHGNCRYDASQAKSPFVKKLDLFLDVVTVCPEIEIGLTVPREAIRIIKENGVYRLVTSMTGEDISYEMKSYVEDFVEKHKYDKVHGFILKSRSPSCGIKDVKVYKAIGKSPSLGEKANGFFGSGIIESFSGLAIEDEGRLTNYNIRDHFLTRIYAFARYDKIIEKQSINELIKFHSNHKYLLMSYHQKYQKELGHLVANHDKKPIDEVIGCYSTLLRKTLEKPLRRGSNINMLMHLFGYFKNELSKDEKAYFLDVLEQYNSKKIPYSVPISLIYVWVIRFNESYLKDQLIFNPYPKEILEVTDSGKGID